MFIRLGYSKYLARQYYIIHHCILFIIQKYSYSVFIIHVMVRVLYVGLVSFFSQVNVRKTGI